MVCSTLPSPATKRYAQDERVSYVPYCPEARLEEEMLEMKIVFRCSFAETYDPPITSTFLSNLGGTVSSPLSAVATPAS
jgi:hypothetical protein